MEENKSFAPEDDKAKEQSGSGQSQTEDEGTNEVSFEDGSGTSENEGRQEQEAERQRNSENARRRREAERQKEMETLRVQTVIETLDGKNPFTGEEMTDAADVDEYLAMREIKKNGGDPIADFAKYRKEKEKEERAAKAAQNEKEAFFAKDREDFHEKYPKVALGDLVADENFILFADGKVGNVPLADIYGKYLQFTERFEEKAKNKAAHIVATAKASPGALGSANKAEGYYSREQVEKMTQAEVHANYDKIMESMKHWQ